MFPYDGMSVGQFGGDAIRNIYGYFGRSYEAAALANDVGGIFQPGNGPRNALSTIINNGVHANSYNYVTFDASNQVPTSYENTPVWMAGLYVISY